MGRKTLFLCVLRLSNMYNKILKGGWKIYFC